MKFDLKNIGENLSIAANKGLNKLKDVSPELCIAAGTIGLISAGVLACKATLKVDKLTEDNTKKLEKIEEVHNQNRPDYTDADYNKDLKIAKVQALGSYVKLYGPSVALAIGSVGFIFSGTRKLRKISNGLAAGYSALSASYGAYRDRVKDELGLEADRHFFTGETKEEVLVTKTNEDGTTETSVESVVTIGEPRIGMHDKFWGPGYVDCCEKGLHEHNKRLLLGIQADLNAKLRRKRKLTVNEIYEALGYPSSEWTDAGMVFGIDIDSTDPRAPRCVDFGLTNVNDNAVMRFVNGIEECILLRINVDPEPLYGSYGRKTNKEVNYVRR